MKIKNISAFQIFDSRGIPTIEAVVTLINGICGRGLVPSGASTGQYEALEIRDGNPNRFRGKSVQRAIDNIHQEIAPALEGMEVEAQAEIDGAMIALDGTPDKSRLGANAILGVSLAVADAAARTNQMQLFQWLGGNQGTLLPLPEIQIIG